MLFIASGLAKSNGDARRAIAQGGIYVNNRRIDDADAVLGEWDLLHGRFAVLRRGKRTLAAPRPSLTVSPTGRRRRDPYTRHTRSFRGSCEQAPGP